MVVSITWALSPAGAPMATPKDCGTIGNGQVGSAVDLYIRHDGINEITDVGFYIRAYSGGAYDGVGSPADDYTELISWGDAWGSAGDGGLEIAQNAGTPSWAVFRTGQGTVSDPIEISTDSGVSQAGEIQTAEEAHIKIRFGVPVAESTAGKRMVDLALGFTYTS